MTMDPSYIRDYITFANITIFMSSALEMFSAPRKLNADDEVLC